MGAICGRIVPPPPPCPSPPLVLPQGGLGDRHLLKPKIFVAAHCVVVAKPPPKSAAQSIPVESVSMCKSSRSSGAGPRKFTPSWSRSRSPYIGSPLNVSYAEFFHFMLQILCLQMCVYGGSAVPQGWVGDRHLVTIPRGWWGTVFPGVGKDKGGRGYNNGPLDDLHRAVH